MPTVPFLDLALQNEPLHEELKAALERVIASGQFILGPEVDAFEEAFAQLCDVRCAVALNSGTSALHLGLLALGVHPGDEVITVAHTFAATAEAILYCGAGPVYVDIDPHTLVMNVEEVETAITDRTRVILPVHLYGNPVDMGRLVDIAGRHGIPVLEDACQAHGALHRGKRVGGWGSAAAFSFYPTKNLGALGEGGILTTNDEDIAQTARMLRNHGEAERYQHSRLGFNYRMTAFQGAVLRTKLPYLESWNNQRRQLADRYRKGLKGSSVNTTHETPQSRAVYHLFVVMVDNREIVQKGLNEVGIETVVYYPTPLYQQPGLTSHITVDSVAADNSVAADLPVTRAVSPKIISLPLYPGMSEETVDAVVEHLRGLVE